MHDESTKTLGVLATAALVVTLALVYHQWSWLARTEPAARSKQGAVWLDTTDVAAGTTIEGRVQIEAGLRTAIRGVIVNGAGPEQITEGLEEAWGDHITYSYRSEEGRAEQVFRVRVPDDAAGRTLHLDLRVEFVSAETSYERAGIGFTNEWDATTFAIDVPVYSQAKSAARRAGRLALAIASWIGVVVLVATASRWYRRRERTPHDAVMLLLLPYGVIGWAWFARLLADASRIDAWWFDLVCVVVWYLAFALVARITAGDAICRYDIMQTRVSAEAGDAYRGGAHVPTRPLAALESAWQAAGFVVLKKSGELTIERLDGATAFVPIPPSGTFGGGETFFIRSDNDALVLELLSPAAAELGELRWQRADDGKLG